MRRRFDALDILAIVKQQGYGIAEGTLPQPAPATPEDLFLGQVRRLARAHGWQAYHTHDARKSDKGFPDLVLARPRTATSPGRLIFAELKRTQGKPTQEQATWLSVLAHTVPGVEVYLWKSHELETIVEILAARLSPTPQGEISPVL